MSIDTSKMSKEKAAALELAEGGRDTLTKSFAGDIFMGAVNFKNVHPYPTQTSKDKKIGNKFLLRLKNVFSQHVDSQSIDTEGEIPDSVFEKLAEIGAFCIKIPEKYDGLGLSQTNYARASIITGSQDGNIAALLSAHQSIGVPQPLLMYGTEEQKERYLPKFAKGAVSAFALTEDDVGSDPAQMKTTADPTEDGDHFIISGEKLWCTNGVKADVIVVMARTPDKGKKKQITAFIVDMDTPGVEVIHRCRFMGLKALYNGVIRFNKVKVPKENIILAEGKGMKVALNTLNIGRLTLPAICVGLMKQNLKICREWTSTRKQWGCEIGKHQAIADKLATITMDLFAMEAMVMMTCAAVDKKKDDIRVESAMCKMWGTERAWAATNETMQIRGGRGYETTESLNNRGEEPIVVERNFRDCRVNLIFEGSSEIMRLILAREALDPHLKVAGDVLNTRLPKKKRIIAGIKAFGFYSKWYLKQWLPIYSKIPKDVHPVFKSKLRYVRLARTLFHAMVAYGPGLDKQQLLLARIAEIGTELFVITATVLRANTKLGKDQQYIIDLANCIFTSSKYTIDNLFTDIKKNNDNKNYKLARNVLAKKYRHLEII